MSKQILDDYCFRIGHTPDEKMQDTITCINFVTADEVSVIKAQGETTSCGSPDCTIRLCERIDGKVNIFGQCPKI